MKKLLLTVIAIIAFGSSVWADGHVDSVRYLTTRWRRNWFVSANATVNWWQSSLTAPYMFENNFTKVYWGQPNIGFSANFGKWINHKMGVRVSYTNNRINSFIYGRHPSLHHFQYIYGDPATLVEAHNGMEVYKTSMRFHNLRADYMIRPIDFFQGYYNPNRIWTPVLYLSAGGSFVSNDLLVMQSVIKYINYKTGTMTNGDATNFELALGAGLLNNFRISEHFDLNLDINWLFQRWTIDSWTYEFGGYGPEYSTRPKRFDNMYTAAIGHTYYFTRMYEVYDFAQEAPCPPCDTLTPKVVTVETDDFISYPFSIFFHRDSYQLMSNRDLVNLREIAEIAKEYKYKIRLRGSCDSATATPSYNQTLSENRCRRVMLELLEMGIPEDQIILVPVGGIKQLDPTEYDRRVVVDLVKD